MYLVFCNVILKYKTPKPPIRANQRRSAYSYGNYLVFIFIHILIVCIEVINYFN